MMDKLDGKDKKRLGGNKRFQNVALTYVNEEGKLTVRVTFRYKVDMWYHLG